MPRAYHELMKENNDISFFNILFKYRNNLRVLFDKSYKFRPPAQCLQPHRTDAAEQIRNSRTFRQIVLVKDAEKRLLDPVGNRPGTLRLRTEQFHSFF